MIFGDKFSVDFLQENRLSICHRKLHQVLHCKQRDLSLALQSGDVLM